MQNCRYTDVVRGRRHMYPGVVPESPENNSRDRDYQSCRRTQLRIRMRSARDWPVGLPRFAVGSARRLGQLQLPVSHESRIFGERKPWELREDGPDILYRVEFSCIRGAALKPCCHECCVMQWRSPLWRETILLSNTQYRGSDRWSPAHDSYSASALSICTPENRSV